MLGDNVWVLGLSFLMLQVLMLYGLVSKWFPVPIVPLQTAINHVIAVLEWQILMC